MKGRSRHKLALIPVGPAATSWCCGELGLWLGIDPKSCLSCCSVSQLFLQGSSESSIQQAQYQGVIAKTLGFRGSSHGCQEEK